MNGDPTKDDAFAALFRPEEPAAPETVDVELEVAESTPEHKAPTSTGRLFRSNTAVTETAAIPALRSDQVRVLRTVNAASITESPAVEEVQVERIRPTKERSVKAKPERVKSNERGLAPLAVIGVVCIVTLLAGLVDVLLGAGLGWIWGVGMLISSAYAAFAARRGDGTYAVTAPAIAALLSVITVAQMNLGASGGGLFDRAVVAFFALGDHWTWIIGSTLVALIIVAVRARTRRA